MTSPDFIAIDWRIVKNMLIECYSTANDFLAMDGLTALTIPGRVHHADSEPAPKETSTSKSIVVLVTTNT